MLLNLVISKDKFKQNDDLKSTVVAQFSSNAVFIIWGQILSFSSEFSILTSYEGIGCG